MKRRCIRKVGSERVSFPMYPPLKHEREKVLQRIESGEIVIGEKVVQTSYTNYTVDTDTHQVQENTIKISARKIPLTTIRKKLLKKHESLGIIRNCSESFFEHLSSEEVNGRLQNLGITCDKDKVQALKNACRTRHLKIWHDHSTIAAHGYLLVLVSVVYDPVFFYSSQEMKDLNMNVPDLLDNAEVHILGRSYSSTEGMSREASGERVNCEWNRNY